MGGAKLAKEYIQCQLTSCQVLTGYNINFAIIWEMAKKENLSMTFTNCHESTQEIISLFFRYVIISLWLYFSKG